VISVRFAGGLRRRWPWLLLLALLAGGVLYRFRWAAIPVEVQPVTVGLLTEEVPGTGTLEARVKAALSARIQERLAEVLVDQGDSVRSGQLVARLDDGELRQQVELTAANLASTGATADRVAVDEGRARAVEEQARTDLQRIEDLVRKKVSSESELDKATERMRIAEADVRRARAATLEARQQVRVSEATLAYHRERLGFTKILSPLDGLVIRRDRDPGGIVLPGSSILQLVATNDLWVSAWIDETSASALQAGQPATLFFRSAGTNEFAGQVVRLGRETDRETREFLVDIAPAQLPSNWTMGQRADVFIQTSSISNAIAIPEKFVHWQQDRTGVYVLAKGRAEWRAVTLGIRGRDQVQIRSGLSAEDRVLLSPSGKQLRNGQRVALP
jgi:HlyD family secretion protein